MHCTVTLLTEPLYQTSVNNLNEFQIFTHAKRTVCINFGAEMFG